MSAAVSSEVEHILTLEAVRERARQVLQSAESGHLNHFDYDESRMPEVAEFVSGIISRDFGPDRFDQIPPHGRWQHFDVGGIPRIAPLIEKMKAEGVDDVETTRRLIDLFFVSVLLDAGAGDVWKFTEPGTGNSYGRSEGIAVASLYMAQAGVFNSSTETSVAVDAAGLVGLTDDKLIDYFQITKENPLIGVSQRVKLLNSVGRSLQRLPDIVGPTGRPGNLVDFLLDSSKDKVLDYKVLWSTLQKILLPAWPSDRPVIEGQPIGDAWPLQILTQGYEDQSKIPVTATIQPFHKLTQWLGYSLTVPFVTVLGLKTVNTELGTGLPEYRNGGLFIDMGVLKLKPEAARSHTAPGEKLPRLSPTHDAVVEWRSMTVALLDKLFELVSSRFAKMGVTLTMAQMLEAGSWKGGRELARKLRPDTLSSPIIIDGDGTLF